MKLNNFYKWNIDGWPCRLWNKYTYGQWHSIWNNGVFIRAIRSNDTTCFLSIQRDQSSNLGMLANFWLESIKLTFEGGINSN